MDWQVIKEYWGIIWALVMTGVNLVMILLAKTYVKREEVDTLKSRVTAMETVIASMPNQKELHALQLEMSNLRGDLKALAPKLAQVQRISDLLLENELKDK
ncbi:hypothetical protein BIY26_09000 [Brenneria goodwinii]|uniref:DUF2730 domain-containing protein n=2 Tax=Brenneria TaxID=71655 RepID=A0AAE8JNK1_9GAMM|nr:MULTISPECIES: DUF2730 family protein [Brenneria]ATA26598.1 hypothetical protein AWC36_22215 [Brenneria goodwinii]RLM25396.1 hypothetical protein BIY26_09000 [Brenneria goodwinii]RLM27493.1 hypothetical protein BIY29_02305 [Brenneria alni]